MTLSEQAVALATRGWSILPLSPNSNKPASTRGLHDATNDPTTIGDLWQKHPKFNFGIALSKSQHQGQLLAVIDVDRHDAGTDGFNELAKLEAEHGALPATLTATTPRNGEHYYFTVPADTSRLPGILGPGIDLKFNGYVVAPPCHRDEMVTVVDTSGKEVQMRIVGDYQWKDATVPIAPLPEWVYTHGKANQATPRTTTTWEDRAPAADTNVDLTREAGRLARFGLSRDTILSALRDFNERIADPAAREPEANLVSIADSAIRNFTPDAAPSWPTPKDLEPPPAPIANLDADLLPEVMREWVADIAYAQQLPFGAVACMALVALATVVGRRRQIQPKRLDTNWVVTPNLYGLVILPPGSRKTPALNAVMRSIYAIDADWKRDFDEKMLEHKKAMALHKSAIQKALKSSDSSDSNILMEPSEPIRRRLFVQDATPEVMLKIAAENPFGVLNIADELSSMLDRMKDANRTQERGLWLTAWDGNSPRSDDRMGRAGNSVEHLALCLWGNIQPDVWGHYIKEVCHRGKNSDGLQQRFQVACWPDIPPFDPTTAYVDRAPDRNLYAAVDALFRRFVDPAYEFDSPRTLKFDQGGQEVFERWSVRLATKNAQADLPGYLIDHFQKYYSLMPSIALLLQLAQNPDAVEVSTRYAVAAESWCRWLKDHAFRMYLSDGMSDESTLALAKHIRAGDLGESFTVTEVTRKKWKKLTQHEDVTVALNELAERGWVRSGPRRQWLVNPKLDGVA